MANQEGLVIATIAARKCKKLPGIHRGTLQGTYVGFKAALGDPEIQITAETMVAIMVRQMSFRR